MSSRRIVTADLKADVEKAMEEAQSAFNRAKLMDRAHVNLSRRSLYLLTGLAGAELGKWKIDELRGPRSDSTEAVRAIVQQFLDRQGHDRCWYYPELLNALVDALGLEQRAPSELPPEEEFRAACERYRQEQYAARSTP